MALLLSGGLPVAYLSAAIWFAAAYWSEKWELLKLSRRPIAYGGDLSEAVTSTVPYAVVSVTIDIARKTCLPRMEATSSWACKYT